ncbi:aldo/keto reductase [Streptomyces sp. DSM 44915]|uniref:Aldo/keto reductase n=1 Tax=Streptomyces chisholmiae TaxID=3075540 RepID=A0ABU2JUR7_9ACTN|nr:aldo/keto reductase [Streptomyces sp. DSM 44915]MDT0267953.1 aldo/keto reductase [Streptomyces sp. DSM 44915]
MRESHPRVVLGLHRSRYQRHSLAAALDMGIRAIDTAFNYHGFAAHQTLGRFRDLLPEFSVSTKVGYFPGTTRAVHSLAPGQLRHALEQTNRDLGRPPNLVFLHNPEHTLSRLSPEVAREHLTSACEVLVNAVQAGLCDAWGVASWRPGPLVGLIDGDTPRPDVLMVRSGLLVAIDTLEASESLATRWRLPAAAVWGMSPFGGKATDPIWDKINPRLFLRSDSRRTCSPIQAAFRAAYYLPRVGSLAVGSDDPAHLRELLASLGAEVDGDTVTRYRTLLGRQRSGSNSPSSRSASARTGAPSST